VQFERCHSEFKPPGTNPLADLDPRETKSASGFSPLSQIWTSHITAYLFNFLSRQS